MAIEFTDVTMNALFKLGGHVLDSNKLELMPFVPHLALMGLLVLKFEVCCVDVSLSLCCNAGVCTNIALKV